MRRWRVAAAGLLGIAVLVAGSAPAAAAPGQQQDRNDRSTACKQLRKIDVPGAEHQRVACLGDLTTAGTVGTPYTVQAHWAFLHAPGTDNPSGVPGVQVDGYFPDTSTTNTTHGWNHDSQFVIRMPAKKDWNGGLVVAGSPGNRAQYANDFIISDFVLAKGYAYAATDKGNTGTAFHEDGTQPGDAIAEWHTRVSQLAEAAQQVVKQFYGPSPKRTIMTGLSNGGYLTRWQLENRPDLYDAGVDAEGTLFRADGPNLFTYLPQVLRAWPDYTSADPARREAGRQAILAAGMPAGSEFLWPTYHQIYWGLTQTLYQRELDPGYTGAPADYDYASRPQSVRDAMRRIELTGDIKRPLITVQGTLDTLLPPSQQSDAYARLVEQAGRDALHRYWVVEGATHVDGFQPTFGDRVRPLLPCYRGAFEAVEAWIGKHGKVKQGTAPGPDRFISRRQGDELNRC